jgi:microcystin degradation protein MlrC
MLKELLKQNAKNAVLALRDPVVVAKAIESGVGSQITTMVGARTDKIHGEPVKVTGKVRLISDGVFIGKGPVSRGVRSEMGRTVVLECDGIDLILTEKRVQLTDVQSYRSLGIEPIDKKIIVVKNSGHFESDYTPIAKKIIEVDTPGLSGPRLAGLNLKHVLRPIFPLDVEMLGLVELKGMEDP